MITKKFCLFIFIGFLIVGISSCYNDDKIDGRAGLAEYRIDNQSTKTLIYKSNPDVIVLPNETKKISQDGGIGIKAPLPSEGLGGLLELYRNDNGNEILALKRDPVVDSEWNEEKQDNEEYGLVYYTLTVTDDMIN